MNLQKGVQKVSKDSMCRDKKMEYLWVSLFQSNDRTSLICNLDY